MMQSILNPNTNEQEIDNPIPNNSAYVLVQGDGNIASNSQSNTTYTQLDLNDCRNNLFEYSAHDSVHQYSDINGNDPRLLHYKHDLQYPPDNISPFEYRLARTINNNSPLSSYKLSLPGS